MVAAMAAHPLIFALANPTPEILPEEVRAVRADAIIATGRTDYPNQVNNVLCFPYIFRGALDCGRDDDHRRDGDRRGACHRRAGAGRAERGGGRGLCRRDAGLRSRVPDPQALRPAADDEDRAGGGARGRRIRAWQARPIADCDAYREKLQSFVYASGQIDEADLRAGQAREDQARGLCRRRGRARAARGAGGGRRRPGAADADRPAGDHRRARREVRPAAEAGHRLRRRQRRPGRSATATSGRPTTA